MKLVTVSQMQEIEKEADANGLSYDQMMQNAGFGLADVIADLFADDDSLAIVGLAGSGNNGGDALVALTALAEAGWKASAYLVKRKKDALVKRFVESGGEVFAGEGAFEQLTEALGSAHVFLDGAFGTGIKLPLKKDVAETLAEINDYLDSLDEPPFVIAVDCPSGVNCDSGETAEETIRADLTVTMAAVKQGLLKLPAFEYVGGLKVVDIGFPPNLSKWKDVCVEVADEDSISALLPERPLDAHKGTFGAALVAAGSVNYAGAVVLAGEAAYRAGAGLVQLAIPASIHTAAAGQIPEATWILLPHLTGVIASGAAEVLLKNLGRATAMLIGPGVGCESATKEFIETLLTQRATPKRAALGFVHEEAGSKETIENALPPLVVDADGLRLLAQIKDWQVKLPAPAILTPHPGEMSALTGISREEIQQDRQSVALKFAREWGHVVVLKGAFTVIAAPDGRMTIIPVASPALARAGSGDALAGVIVGLRAQGLDAYDAATAGAWIHAQAGLYAADDLGSTAAVMASDIVNSIPDVLCDLE